MQKNQEKEKLSAEPEKQQNSEQKQTEGEKKLDKKQERQKRREEQLKRKLEAKQKKQRENVEKGKPKEKKQEKQDKGGKKKQKLIFPQGYLELVNSQNINLGQHYHPPTKEESNILITSALPYVNNVPHLGNLIGCVLSADVFARFKRLHGDNTIYICGTDEYGAATVVKAMKDKMTPRQVCDKYYTIHNDIYKWFNISFDIFGRTSTEWHTKITLEIYNSLNQNKFINKQTISQAFCPTCQLFLADRFVVGTCPLEDCKYQKAKGDQCDKCGKLIQDPMDLIQPKCHVCQTTPIVKQTEHYFLTLEDIQKQLEEWVNISCVEGEWSSNSTAIAKSWLKQGLKPKCITRDILWGVPVPGQEKKVFYVWFDAPIGYISITANLLNQGYEKWWKNPQDVKLYQFMGKDNVPFHTVIFPSSLIGTKQKWTLLHHISTTEYLTYEGGKFSKSEGTGVFGDDAKNTGIPSDVWRYYLLINRPQKSDSDFWWNDLAQRNNNQLLANIGNLCNRALMFCCSNLDKKIPQITKQELSQVDIDFLNIAHERLTEYINTLNKVQIKDGLRVAMSISSIANKYLQDNEPWKPENKQSGRSKTILAVVLNFIRLLSAVFEPYLPETSAKINFFLGLSNRTQIDSKLIQFVKDKQTFIERFVTLTSKSEGMQPPVVLFKEITPAEVKSFQEQFGKQGKQKKQQALKKQQQVQEKKEQVSQSTATQQKVEEKVEV